MNGIGGILGKSERADHPGWFLRGNLAELGAFALISLGALGLKEVDVLGGLPEGLARVLGCRPPVELVNLMLAVYGISSLILILNRIGRRLAPINSWMNPLTRGAFYVFYAMAGTLERDFSVVALVALGLFAAELVNQGVCNGAGEQPAG